jgi:predicted CXXCH cytochrome family protein
MLLLPLLAFAGERATSDVCLACHGQGSAPEIRSESSHPIQIDYDPLQSASAGHLRPSTAPSGFGSTIKDDLLVEGRVECTSCHYSHEESTETKFRLRNDGVFQKLCVGCHDMSRD